MSVLLPYIPTVFVLLVASWALWQQHRSSKSKDAAYERILDRRDREYESLLDRWFARQNLPPNKVELKNEYDEHREEAKQARVERKNGGPLGRATGPIDSELLQIEVDERRARVGNPRA